MKFNKSVLLLLPVLSACSNPATETPVDMKPGLYQAELSGQFAGLVDTGDMYKDGKQKSISFCYRGLSDGYPVAPIEELINPEGRCGRPGLDRRGNMLTLTGACGIDPDKGVGQIKYTYTGKISETSLVGDIKAEADIPVINDPSINVTSDQMNAMASMYKMHVKIDRVGDC
jgi:hypothetical protein